jgi:AAHS family 4-hydroxybenzoate transporter-like MFS transporter
VGTFALALVLLFTLPESVRWMVAKGKPAARISQALSKFDPAVARSDYAGFRLTDERKTRGESPWAKSAELFRGALAFVTPVIWFTYFCSSFAIYLRASYGIVFLEQLGVNRIEGTNIGSFGGLVGAVGGVMLLAFTEKRGPLWIALAPLIGVPTMLAVGWGLTGGPWFIPVIVAGTIMVGVGHAAVISMTTIYYPSAVRSTGGGWASFVAKFAAVAAPILGAAWFLGSTQSVLNGYAFTGYCLAGVVVGIVALAFSARRLQTERALRDVEPVAA